MTRTTAFLVVVVTITTLTFGTCNAEAGKHGRMMKGGMRGHMMGERGHMDKVSVKRHRLYMRGGLPAEYAGKTNPYKPTPDLIKRGEEIYMQQCKACHGESGRGDGPAAKGLDPKPSDLSFIMKRHIATDEYLFWTIAEGGKPIGSTMPAYKGILSEKDIWAVILYLRDRFGR